MKSAARGPIRIGISGWRYRPWRGVFYPDKLPQRAELGFAASHFPSLEINGSFYSLQTPRSYRSWSADTPDDFVFAVKCPRYITHMRRLRDIDGPLANFFASGVLLLERKLGPMLWQFPPHLKFDPERWSAFLEKLPTTLPAASRCAQTHNERVRQFEWPANPPRRRLRHAVEIRNDSFRDPAFIKLLRKHEVALVVADTAGKWPYVEDATTDFMYLRLHGDKELYASGYSEAALQRWARRIDLWAQGGEPDDAVLIAPQLARRKFAARAVYCYFDNDIKVRAPFDAKRLGEILGARA